MHALEHNNTHLKKIVSVTQTFLANRTFKKQDNVKATLICTGKHMIDGYICSPCEGVASSMQLDWQMKPAFSVILKS
jgi:hypothetical protein